MACATIITDRGGLPETTKHPILLKKLDSSSLYIEIKKLINSSKQRSKFQKLNYRSFYLTHEYVSDIIDKVRLKISADSKVNNFNIKLLSNYYYTFIL